LAVLALSAMATTTAAAAVEGPFWKVNGQTLKASETRLLLAKAKGTWTLEWKAKGVTILCNAITLSGAAHMQIQGLVAGNGGISNEAIDFTGCTQIGNGELCEVTNDLIATTPLLNLLGYSSSTRGGPVLVLFEPESGSTFMNINFIGEGCHELAFPVAGTVVGQAQVAGTPVAVGGGTETLYGEVKFPSARTIWIERGGILKETKAKLELGGIAWSVAGVALLLVDEGGAAVKWGIFS
jgi:hypothetical protein